MLVLILTNVFNQPHIYINYDCLALDFLVDILPVEPLSVIIPLEILLDIVAVAVLTKSITAEQTPKLCPPKLLGPKLDLQALARLVEYDIESEGVIMSFIDLGTPLIPFIESVKVKLSDI